MVDPRRLVDPPRLVDPLWRAVAWMSGALASFLTMAIAGRELAAEVTLFQILFMRNAICVLILLGICARVGFRVLRTAILARHVARNVLHFSAQYAWFFGVISIPLAEVFAIEFTTPMWTAILAAMFLGERLTATRIAAIALGLVGVLVIVRPGLAIVHPAALAVLFAALGYAATYVITKRMIETERPLTILFWMNAVQLPLSVVPATLAWVTPSLPLWPWVALVGIGGLTSHYCLSRALVHADASLVVPFDFLRLPLGAVLAWMLYAEPLDPLVFLGAVLILGGNWLNMRKA